MAIVDAHVFYWTKDGMRQQLADPLATGYVSVREVERLLEETHRIAYERGAAEGAEALAFYHL